jgi:O-antigen ligase
VHKNVVGVSEAEGDYQRFALWRIAWKYATTFPLGVGVGNYRSYNSYYYGVKWGATSHGSAHGTYAQLLTEMGIPGLVLFVWILVGGFRWMFNSYRRLDPGFSRTFVLAAMGQLIGISVASLLGDYIIPSYHNGGPTNFCATVYSWLIWGVAAAHIRISKTSDKLPENMAEDVK